MSAKNYPVPATAPQGTEMWFKELEKDERLDMSSHLRSWNFTKANCARCGIKNSDIDGLLIQCGKCKEAYYCSKACFNADIMGHLDFCRTACLRKGPSGSRFRDPRYETPDIDPPIPDGHWKPPPPPKKTVLENPDPAPRKNVGSFDYIPRTRAFDRKEPQVQNDEESESESFSEDVVEVAKPVEPESVKNFDDDFDESDPKMVEFKERVLAAVQQEYARQLKIGCGGVPTYEFNPEHVTLKEALTLKREYGWHIPDWVLNPPIKSTARGDKAKTEGNLAAPVTHIDAERVLPEWALKPALRKSGKSDLIKQGGDPSANRPQADKEPKLVYSKDALKKAARPVADTPVAPKASEPAWTLPTQVLKKAKKPKEKVEEDVEAPQGSAAKPEVADSIESINEPVGDAQLEPEPEKPSPWATARLRRTSKPSGYVAPGAEQPAAADVTPAVEAIQPDSSGPAADSEAETGISDPVEGPLWSLPRLKPAQKPKDFPNVIKDASKLSPEPRKELGVTSTESEIDDCVTGPEDLVGGEPMPDTAAAPDGFGASEVEDMSLKGDASIHAEESQGSEAENAVPAEPELEEDSTADDDGAPENGKSDKVSGEGDKSDSDSNEQPSLKESPETSDPTHPEKEEEPDPIIEVKDVDAEVANLAMDGQSDHAGDSEVDEQSVEDTQSEKEAQGGEQSDDGVEIFEEVVEVEIDDDEDQSVDIIEEIVELVIDDTDDEGSEAREERQATPEPIPDDQMDSTQVPEQIVADGDDEDTRIMSRVQRFDDEYDEDDEVMRIFKRKMIEAIKELYGRRLKLGNGEIPWHEFNPEIITLRQVMQLKRKYGWEIPEWVLNPPLRRTERGEMLMTQGRLEMSASNFSELPDWAVQTVLKESEKAEIIKQGGSLYQVGASLSPDSSKPGWALNSPLKRAPKVRVDSTVASDLEDRQSPQRNAPVWATKSVLKSSEKSDIIKKGGSLYKVGATSSPLRAEWMVVRQAPLGLIPAPDLDVETQDESPASTDKLASDTGGNSKLSTVADDEGSTQGAPLSRMGSPAGGLPRRASLSGTGVVSPTWTQPRRASLSNSGVSSPEWAQKRKESLSGAPPSIPKANFLSNSHVPSVWKLKNRANPVDTTDVKSNNDEQVNTSKEDAEIASRVEPAPQSPLRTSGPESDVPAAWALKKRSQPPENEIAVVDVNESVVDSKEAIDESPDPPVGDEPPLASNTAPIGTGSFNSPRVSAPSWALQSPLRSKVKGSSSKPPAKDFSSAAPAAWSLKASAMSADKVDAENAAESVSSDH